MDSSSSKVKCCCCIPIRAGVWTLAVLGVIGAVCSIVEASVYLASGVTAADIRKETTSQEVKDNAETILAITRGANLAKLGFSLLHLGLSILLILGLKDFKPSRLRFWVKANLAFVIFFALVGLFALITTMVLVGTGVGVAIGLFAIILIALIILWQGYYMWVVYKYAGIMEEENERNGHANVTYAVGVEKA